jgi:hypothetical protein
MGDGGGPRPVVNPGLGPNAEQTKEERVSDTKNGETTQPDGELLKWARVGAEIEYEELLRRQAKLNRIFPGINKAAQLKVAQDRAAHARASKTGNRKAG